MSISITKYNIHEWFMAAGVFCMSVYSKGVTVFLALAFLAMVVQIFFGGRKVEWRTFNGWAFLLFGVLSVFLLTGFWNEWNHQTALSEVETKISYLAFPLLFLFTSNSILHSLRRFQWALVSGCVFFAVTCHVHAFFGFFETGLWEEFVYGRLSWTFHPTYLGFFYLLSMVFLASEFLDSTSKKKSNLLLLGIVFFSLETAFMASRAGFLALFLFYVVFVFYVFRNEKKQKEGTRCSFIFNAFLHHYVFKLFAHFRKSERGCGKFEIPFRNEKRREGCKHERAYCELADGMGN